MNKKRKERKRGEERERRWEGRKGKERKERFSRHKGDFKYIKIKTKNDLN
jgi:hypothetical protein